MLVTLPLGKSLVSSFEGHLYGSRDLNFLGDIELHVRFLLALPILIGSELVLHDRLRSVLGKFVGRGIVIPEDEPKFRAALESVIRARNSVWLEIALLLFVYTVGHWVWEHEAVLRTVTCMPSPMERVCISHWRATCTALRAFPSSNSFFAAGICVLRSGPSFCRACPAHS